MDYVLILIVGFIGGIPLAAMFAKAELPMVGLFIWACIFAGAIWAVADVASNRKPRRPPTLR